MKTAKHRRLVPAYTGRYVVLHAYNFPITVRDEIKALAALQGMSMGEALVVASLEYIEKRRALFGQAKLDVPAKYNKLKKILPT